MSSFDLSEFKVIAAMDIAAAIKSGAKSVTLRPGVVITPSARDAAASAGIELSVSAMTAPSAAPASDVPTCQNCGTPLLGPHCYRCGQPVNGLVRHFTTVLGDFLDRVRAHEPGINVLLVGGGL